MSESKGGSSGSGLATLGGAGAAPSSPPAAAPVTPPRPAAIRTHCLLSAEISTPLTLGATEAAPFAQQAACQQDEEPEPPPPARAAGGVWEEALAARAAVVGTASKVGQQSHPACMRFASSSSTCAAACASDACRCITCGVPCLVGRSLSPRAYSSPCCPCPSRLQALDWLLTATIWATLCGLRLARGALLHLATGIHWAGAAALSSLEWLSHGCAAARERVKATGARAAGLGCSAGKAALGWLLQPAPTFDELTLGQLLAGTAAACLALAAAFSAGLAAADVSARHAGTVPAACPVVPATIPPPSHAAACICQYPTPLVCMPYRPAVALLVRTRRSMARQGRHQQSCAACWEQTRSTRPLPLPKWTPKPTWQPCLQRKSASQPALQVSATTQVSLACVGLSLLASLDLADCLVGQPAQSLPEPVHNVTYTSSSPVLRSLPYGLPGQQVVAELAGCSGPRG